MLALPNPGTRSWRTALLLGSAALAALAGCSKGRVQCYGEIEKDDLYKMQQLIQEGKEVCTENHAPKIEVSFSGIVLNGRTIAPWSVLPEGEAKKVAPLFDELKELREIWKQLHPALRFDPDTTVEIAGDIDALAGVGILLSIAYAGYPRMRVRSGEVKFDAYWAVPMPPNPDADTQGPETLRVGRTPEDWYELRFDGPPKKQRPAGWAVRDVPSLAQAIQEACAPREGACAQIVDIQVRGGTFLEVARLARMVLQSPAFAKRYPTLRLSGPGSP